MTALDVSFRIETNKLFQRLQEFGDANGVGPYVGSALRRSLFAYRREFIRGNHKGNPVKFGRGRGAFNSPAKANAPARNVNSFLIESRPKNEKRAKLDELYVAYYTRSLVARALETGATARPDGGGKWLTIPIGVAKTPGGKTRRYWSSPSVLKRNRRNIRTRFMRRRGSSTAVILVDAGNVGGRRSFGPQRQRSRRLRKTRWRPAWLLVPRVQIPARLGFLSGWDRLGPEIFDKRIGAEFDRYMRERFGRRR